MSLRLDTVSSGTLVPIGSPGSEKYAFDAEVKRYMSIVRRLGRRLTHHLRSTAEFMSMPDAMFTQSLRLYQDSMLGLLKEQREREKLARLSGLSELSEAEHASALEAFRRETMLAMSDEELEKLAAERKALKP